VPPSPPRDAAAEVVPAVLVRGHRGPPCELPPPRAPPLPHTARYLTAYTEGDNAADASDYAPARSREPVDCYDLDADEGGSYGDDYSDVGRCARSARTGRGTARRCCQDGGCAAAATLAAWMLEVELARAAVAVAAAQRGRRTASFAPTQSPR